MVKIFISKLTIQSSAGIFGMKNCSRVSSKMLFQAE
ncbi:hypothetical protein POX_d05884 [Penicillium oxalicum]|uniref:Uncharacterized protein n=1 Tax=Penicillium oxalicum (strain 114-2 / CGMCC 5302) TaxID=933388 RepID=S7ZNK4_PENO1|nr:hypothetical protein POX_d05884 [Penicillium oxalicum]EPS31934.1 hypothetical protein PDE_06893 [Penicillium oxalicum 114-2]KAI2790373.1 hypothetical protein POX_d05884 [Penicillium oxalicum]